MNEYYFLFLLVFIWTVFATIQDIRKREVSNWLNFSLIAFALAYRAFYASVNHNPQFFLFGVIGFFIFFALAYAFYYGRVFAGGDAKLLMGYGVVLPFKSYSDFLFLTIFFIFLLFLVGAIYSLIYSLALVSKNKDKFLKELKVRLKSEKKIFILSLICIIFLFFILNNYLFLILGIAIILSINLLFIYLKSLENSCLIKLIDANKLTEGDWLEKDVKIGNKFIRKSVHGLSLEDIKLLRKAKKKVYIKLGIPFVPAFLITLIIMVFFFLFLQLDLAHLFYLF